MSEKEIAYLKDIPENTIFKFKTTAGDAVPREIITILTDMSMPNMTGEKLAREMIAIRPDIPVILCTGFSERIDEKKAEAIGIKAFLMKLVVNRDIAQTVRKVLDGERFYS